MCNKVCCTNPTQTAPFSENVAEMCQCCGITFQVHCVLCSKDFVYSHNFLCPHQTKAEWVLTFCTS